MIKFLFITTLIFSTQAFAQSFKSADEIAKKLGSYKVADIDGDAKRLANKQKLKIDDMFDDLDAAVKFFSTTELTEDAAFQIQRVSLLTFLHDPSTFAVDLVLPLYDKNKDLFKKASKRLHPYDQQLIEQTYEGKSKAAKDGQD